jgi:hypothetical protein
MAEVASRSADVYVFVVHAHQDKVTLDPLDVDQWEFYVLPTQVLNERVPTQKSITLASLLKLGPTKVWFEGLREAIDALDPASQG